jgi:hypothetical protein
MRWKKRRDKKINSLGNKLSQEGKVIKKSDTNKIKGGKVRKERIWNGCGGIIPW